MSDITDSVMQQPGVQPSRASNERSFDESGAQRLERQLFFALLGGMLLLVAWLGRFAFGFEMNKSYRLRLSEHCLLLNSLPFYS